MINGEEIVTTVDHPFYVKNQGFIKAGELIVGFGVLVHNADDTYSRLRKVSPDAKAKKAVNSVDGKKN